MTVKHLFANGTRVRYRVRQGMLPQVAHAQGISISRAKELYSVWTEGTVIDGQPQKSVHTHKNGTEKVYHYVVIDDQNTEVMRKLACRLGARAARGTHVPVETHEFEVLTE